MYLHCTFRTPLNTKNVVIFQLGGLEHGFPDITDVLHIQKATAKVTNRLTPPPERKMILTCGSLQNVL